jgi:hypothetical protein
LKPSIRRNGTFNFFQLRPPLPVAVFNAAAVGFEYGNFFFRQWRDADRVASVIAVKKIKTSGKEKILRLVMKNHSLGTFGQGDPQPARSHQTAGFVPALSLLLLPSDSFACSQTPTAANVSIACLCGRMSATRPQGELRIGAGF